MAINSITVDEDEGAGGGGGYDVSGGGGGFSSNSRDMGNNYGVGSNSMNEQSLIKLNPSLRR